MPLKKIKRNEYTGNLNLIEEAKLQGTHEDPII